MSPLTGRRIFDHVFLTTELPETPPGKGANGHVHASGHANGHANGHTDGHIDATTHCIGHTDLHRHVPAGDNKFEWAKKRVAAWLDEAGLAGDGGVDKVVEATGVEDGMMYGVALGKQGSTCECDIHVNGRELISDLAVGLSHQQTHAFPTLAVTYKEMDVKGITRYTSVCFPRALDMLARGVVDLKPIITASYPLSQSQQAFEAVASGQELKVIIRNQEA
jgi:D-xylulose reductase